LFDQVGIRASSRAAGEQFYETVLASIGIAKTYSGDDFASWGDFSLAEARDGLPVTRGLHVGFVAPSHELVDRFWQTGVDAGYRDDGRPGPRPEYGDTYYGGFLLDPDGNSAEAVCHDGLREGGAVDHVWIRVADVAAAKRFYETIAPYAGLRLAEESAERVQFRGATSSFSLVPGTPTEQLHMAFPTDDDGDVVGFHTAAFEAGYRDNGEPGERSRYHPGYYAAYILDPDGNNIEVVNHHRGDPAA
jgi:catechol 2,3-dioxygenase-like lactoylglutathione lyase family enzyme